MMNDCTMRITTGFDLFGSHSVRIEINGYQINVINGRKDNDTNPYYSINFNRFETNNFLKAMTELMSILKRDGELKND